MSHEHAEHAVHDDSVYVKIWAILLVLFTISVLGPMLGHPTVTLVTAFGIAIIKAGIVCAYFMHLNTEKHFVWYMLLAALFLVALMFAGVAPDVMQKSGANWRHCGACGRAEATQVVSHGEHPTAGHHTAEH
jgi:caa(3)-type oxidase subunit IV